MKDNWNIKNNKISNIKSHWHQKLLVKSKSTFKLSCSSLTFWQNVLKICFDFGTNAKMCSSKLLHISIFVSILFSQTFLQFAAAHPTCLYGSYVALLFTLFIRALPSPSPLPFRFRFHFCLLLPKITFLHSFYFRAHFRIPSYLGLALVSWRNFWQPTLKLHRLYTNIYVWILLRVHLPTWRPLAALKGWLLAVRCIVSCRPRPTILK